MLLLKWVLMAKLAELGAELPLEPPVRGIDREIVRAEFYAQTPVDGTEAQKQEIRRKRFNRALERAVEQQLIGVREIGDVTTCGCSQISRTTVSEIAAWRTCSPPLLASWPP